MMPRIIPPQFSLSAKTSPPSGAEASGSRGVPAGRRDSGTLANSSSVPNNPIVETASARTLPAGIEAGKRMIRGT